MEPQVSGLLVRAWALMDETSLYLMMVMPQADVGFHYHALPICGEVPWVIGILMLELPQVVFCPEDSPP